VTYRNLRTFTLQRPRGISSAQVLDQVNVEENPAPSELGTGDQAGLGAGGQGGGVELQEGSGFLEREGAHGDGDCRRAREVGETGWGVLRRSQQLYDLVRQCHRPAGIRRAPSMLDSEGLGERKDIMAYQARVVPVMIASPGDVTEERDVIRGVIHDWNDVNAQASSVMLAAVGWDSHSSPELGVRPQELINERILKDCDLLVGVFWTRLGTPTGKAASGTVEEIEEHVAAGKPAMIYFSSKPVAPDSIDPEQYAKVRQARDKWRSQGLIETYDSVEEFRGKFSKQLPLCLAKNKYLQGVLNSPTFEIVTPQMSSSPRPYPLSEEARSLLKAAASTDDGAILKIAHLGGRFIQAGGQSFGEGRGRESARWEAALNELEKEGLVIGRGYKGEIYELTHEGWAVADALQ
jgi:hypothetical protein